MPLLAFSRQTEAPVSRWTSKAAWPELAWDGVNCHLNTSGGGPRLAAIHEISSSSVESSGKRLHFSARQRCPEACDQQVKFLHVLYFSDPRNFHLINSAPALNWLPSLFGHYDVWQSACDNMAGASKLLRELLSQHDSTPGQWPAHSFPPYVEWLFAALIDS